MELLRNGFGRIRRIDIDYPLPCLHLPINTRNTEESIIVTLKRVQKTAIGPPVIK